MGYTMFGDATKYPFTPNMPEQFVDSNLAMWTIVINTISLLVNT